VLVSGLVHAKSGVRQFSSVRSRRRQRRKRSVDEAVGILWGIIDEAKFYMADPVLRTIKK
jgi:hypothetical protein